MTTNANSILALDIGTVRIGVAIADAVARLPRPLTTLANDESFIEQVLSIITSESVTVLVVGLPRSLDGDDTDQTRLVRSFVASWESEISLPISYQDEALSSARAKDELQSRGRPYQKAAVDALAATFILEDYLLSKREAI